AATTPTGQLTRVDFPYGAYAEYTYAGFNGLEENVNSSPLVTKTLTYSDPESNHPPETWTYDIHHPSAHRPWTSVTNPDGGVAKYYFRTLNNVNNQLRGRTVRIDQPDGSRLENIWDEQGLDFNPYLKTEIRSVGDGTTPVKAAVKDFVEDFN